jgi:predicted metal-dependent peptidase
MSNNHPKITNSIDVMISDAMLGLQYYGEFCQYINFKNYHAIGTCGVRVDLAGMRYFYNEEFVDEMTQGEMNFIMLHEVLHLLWDHQARTRRCGYDHELSNIVQDMIINDVIKTDIIDKMEYSNKINKRNCHFADIPRKEVMVKHADGSKTVGREVWVLEKPAEYKGKLSYEEMYEWIYGEKQKYDEWKDHCECDKSLPCKCNRKDGGTKEGNQKCKCQECPVSNYLRGIFEKMDMGLLEWLDKHLPSDIPEDYRKSIIENVKNNLRARGLESADILATLDKITKSKKDYIKNIKIGINELFGNYKNKSITKRNRRSIEGVKGKRKESYALNVLLDVSGSMEGYFEKALSYIFQNGIKINLIQCDTVVKDYMVIKDKAHFRKIKINGLGGTILQPGIDFISSNKDLSDLNTLILTDGMTDELDVTKLKKTMIISHNQKCKVIGEARQIVIKE